MTRKNRDNFDDGDPEPLHFDEDEKLGISKFPKDVRGDSEDDQYYEEEEAISPEEVEDREEEDDL